jgi:hypothetical protein
MRMSDDKNLDQDPEEENKDQFDDEDDFGLPDLEYDELDDDDDLGDDFDLSDEEIFDQDEAFEDSEETEDAPQEEPVEEEVSADLSEKPEPEETSTEELDSNSEDEDVDLGDIDLDDIDMDDIDLDDLDEDMEGMDISDEELEKELADLDTEGIGTEAIEEESTGGDEPSEEQFYEEENYEEFAGSQDEVLDSVFGSDDDSTLPQGPKETPVYSEPEKVVYGGSSGDRKNFTRIVIIGTIVITVIAVIFIVLWNNGAGEPPKEEIAEVVPKKEEPKPEPEPVVIEEKAPETPKPVVANTTTPGEVQTMSSRTGKSYLIVSSFIDEDLAMDHANQLASEGASPMIIPPFDNYRFYRVAIAEFNTFSDANSNLAQYRDQYGADVWALRY